jgi:hypothetical protein
MKVLSFLLALSLTRLAVSQTPATLAEYLAEHPTAGGLAVGAESQKADGTGAGLAAYKRKAFRVGGIVAIAPTEMIQFDESQQPSPNLYDGMPRSAKVLYLMTSLTPQQWRTASGGAGIGLNDLQGEQRDVFLSILPRSFKWTKEKVGPRRLWGGEKVGAGTVEGKDVQSLRLRLERTLQFEVPLVENENSYTVRFPEMEAGSPGDVVARRDDSDERNPSDLFGVAVRTTVPNVPKRGQLDTSRLNASVTLPEKTTVGAALAQIGAATGREILADGRVRQLSLWFPEGKARAGDLLDAIALAVTGTYRRVGPAYVLAADVVGAGTRAVRLGLWREDVDAEVARRQDQWQKAIAKAGLVQSVRFDPKSPLNPGPELQKRLALPPGDPDYYTLSSSDDLTSEQRAFLERQAKQYANQPTRTDKFRARSTLRFRFVLPDGNATQPEGYLGHDWQFVPTPPSPPIGPDPALPMGAIPEGAVRPLALRLASVPDVARAVAVAKAFGFSELWVETERPEVLAAAVASGLPTRLLARPWALGAARPDSDKTILGETGQSAAARMAASAGWTQLAYMVRMQSWPRLGPIAVDGDLLSPFDPQWSQRRAALATLARVPGLAGVVLTEAMPHGYEAKDDTTMYGSYARPRVEMWAFGYDERARLAFLKAKGIDPVDLFPDHLRIDVDMYTAAFPRYPKSGGTMDQIYGEWTKFLAEANAKALAQFRGAIPNVPLFVDVRRATRTLPPLNQATLREWTRGDELPSYQEQYVDRRKGDLVLVTAPAIRSDAMTDFGNAVKYLSTQADASYAFDLTRVPPGEWEALLRQWLKRREPTPPPLR